MVSRYSILHKVKKVKLKGWWIQQWAYLLSTNEEHEPFLYVLCKFQAIIQSTSRISPSVETIDPPGSSSVDSYNSKNGHYGLSILDQCSAWTLCLFVVDQRNTWHLLHSCSPSHQHCQERFRHCDGMIMMATDKASPMAVLRCEIWESYSNFLS